MTVPLNRATPAQVAAFYDRRDPDQKRKKAAPKRFVTQRVVSKRDGWEFQLPIYVDSKQANGFWRRAHQGASNHKYDVITAVAGHAPLMAARDRICAVEFIRVAQKQLDADNVGGAFKACLDAASVSIVEGELALRRLWVDRRGNKRVWGKDIGHFDNKVFGTGKVKCHHAQVQHEFDGKLYGIRIRFRLRPS